MHGFTRSQQSGQVAVRFHAYRHVIAPARRAVDLQTNEPYVPAALLLCGDKAVTCSALEHTVRQAGLEVVANVSLWSRALQALADTTVDVVIVDIAMAGTVGIRIVNVLHAIAPHCKVIVITPDAHMATALRDHGAYAVVSGTDLRPLGMALRRIKASQRRDGPAVRA